MGTTDSKLAFRKSVFRLFEEKNIPANMDEYWTLFWSLPETIDDVYSLISNSDIRRTRDTAIKNLETLIDRLMAQMDLLINSPDLQVIQLLNCCRVLTRIMPFIFESPEHANWEKDFFWTPRLIKKETADDQKEQYDTLPPRGEILLSLTLRSLFLSGFTVPSTVGNPASNVSFVIWETGVGCSTPIGSSRDNDMNRTEILRLLAVLLSKSMYTVPSQIVSKESHWIKHITTKIEKKIVLALLCSLINISCKYNPMGWTVVPYNHIMFNDPKESLVAYCLQTLLIILDYSSPDARQIQINTNTDDIVEVLDAESPKQKSSSDVESSGNIFRYYLSKLHRGQDFQFLIDGIYRILNSSMQMLNNYIPGSLKRVRYHVEMLMFCWKLLETNKRFTNYLMETERGLDLMVALIFYANENKLDPSQVGLVRMCIFMLQNLSSNRTFSVKINKSFDGHASLPAGSKIPNFQGSYANYLIISIFSLVESSKGTLSTLYPALVITVNNISPYLKHLSSTASSKLLALFNSMSATGFLLADEANHKLIGYLLDAFDNIIRFQFSDNPNFILALIQNQQKFKGLSNFNLDVALNEKEKKELNREEEGLSEKAKGKLPDNASSSSQVTLNNDSPAQFSGEKDDFVPTDEWVSSWHSQLSLETVLFLIDYLAPRLEKSTMANGKTIEHLNSISFSDIPLPPPAHSLMIRKFQWSEALIVWFQSMLWGHTYISSVSHYGPWNNTQIKLFHIKHQQPSEPSPPPFNSQPSSPTVLSPRSSLTSPRTS
ncbi:high-temperature-induced dauer-formation protein-domain-containing protein [Sporodiniella umbellata]|nr:high-temperature-induced dauer-formation protein-domain-containing protein [Sporodiniella umbellata]